jgi:hypothetical protein
MPRTLRTLLLLLPLAAGTAHAQSPTRQWRQAASLPPGTQLQIRLQDRPHAIPCTLIWIDLNALACDTYDPRGLAHRTVYPAANVASIKRRRTPDEDDDHRRNQKLLLAAAAGGLFGGFVGKNDSTGTGFALAGIGALVGAAIATAPHLASPPLLYPYPWRP